MDSLLLCATSAPFSGAEGTSSSEAVLSVLSRRRNVTL